MLCFSTSVCDSTRKATRSLRLGPDLAQQVAWYLVSWRSKTWESDLYFYPSGRSVVDFRCEGDLSHLPVCLFMCRSQQDNLTRGQSAGNCFSLTTLWALGIDLRLLGLGAGVSIQRAISLAGSLVLTVAASKSFSGDAIIWLTSELASIAWGWISFPSESFWNVSWTLWILCCGNLRFCSTTPLS